MNKRCRWKRAYKDNIRRKINFTNNYLDKTANERYLTKAKRFRGDASIVFVFDKITLIEILIENGDYLGAIEALNELLLKYPSSVCFYSGIYSNEILRFGTAPIYAHLSSSLYQRDLLCYELEGMSIEIPSI